MGSRIGIIGGRNDMSMNTAVDFAQNIDLTRMSHLEEGKEICVGEKFLTHFFIIPAHVKEHEENNWLAGKAFCFGYDNKSTAIKIIKR